MFRWGDNTTVKFVNAYVEQECLWNVKSPLYKNKGAKAVAIYELDKVMGIPEFHEKEIKKKIKSIRSTYSQELKKVKDSKSSGLGTDTVYVPNVKWFSILDERIRNLYTEITKSESNLENESNTEHTDDSKIFTATETEASSSGDNFCQPKLINSSKRRKLSDLKTMVSQLKDMTETANSSPEENEFDVFGKHVAVQLKTLPFLLALEAQGSIQMFLNSIRRQHVMQNCAKENITGTNTNTPMGSPLPGTSSDDLQSLQSVLRMREPLPTATCIPNTKNSTTSYTGDLNKP